MHPSCAGSNYIKPLTVMADAHRVQHFVHTHAINRRFELSGNGQCKVEVSRNLTHRRIFFTMSWRFAFGM